MICQRSLQLLFVVPLAVCFGHNPVKNILAISPAIDLSLWPTDCKKARSVEEHFVCTMRCPAVDPVVEDALSPWWDVRFSDAAFQDMCAQGGAVHLAFQAAVVSGRLFYKRCSTSGEEYTSDMVKVLDVVLGIARIAQLPDVVFNFNTGDQPFVDKTYWAPVPQFHFVLAKGHWTIPLPSPFHLNAFFDDVLGDSSVLIKDPVPWSDRESQIFWRGSFSVPDNTPFSILAATPRWRLMRLSDTRPDLFDVGIHQLDSAMEEFFSPEQFQKITEHFKPYMREVMNFKETLPKYKYVLNIAAVLSSWRLPELLSSGALLFYQEGSDSDLIRALLTPWVHYVPVRNDMSDLIEKLDYMVAHDDEAQRIAEAGLAFYRSNVTRSALLCYVWRLLRSVGAHTDLAPADLASYEKNFQEVKQSNAESVMKQWSRISEL